MKKMLVNTRWYFFVFLFSVLAAVGVLGLREDLWISICAIAIGAFLILGYAFIIPNRYMFSVDGITVCYCFGMKTFLKWTDIKHFEDHWDSFWCRSYEIGYFNTKIVFHQEATIPKTKKTTAQIGKYYHKTIEKLG